LYRKVVNAQTNYLSVVREGQPSLALFTSLKEERMSAQRNAYHKQWRDKKAKQDPFYSHKKALRELYKTTKEWYDAKLAEQDGHCALCPIVITGGKRLHVDHNHECCSGKRACGSCNRGLLCGGCNIRIGFLQPVLKEGTIVPKEGTWTARAIAYLESYETKPWNFTESALTFLRLALAAPGNGIRITNVQVPYVL
jgi:hypothetical protein